MKKIIEFNNLFGILHLANSKKGIIFVHGFERTSYERKFISIIKTLREKFNFLQFDFSDCGLSNGNFEDFTIQKSVLELKSVIEEFKKQSNIEEIVLFAHSVGACIALKYLEEYKNKNIKKIVLLAPALNQKELHRFWFAKGNNKKIEIDWKNYRSYLDEEAFLKFANLKQKELKEHFISNKYWLENIKLDYNSLIGKINQKIFVIHGDKDDKVPLESNLTKPNIIVKKGDHDLQRPSMLNQWLNKVVDFLEK